MRSAAAYTNKCRVMAESGNNKVQYPGRVASNSQILAPTCRINPDFRVVNYVDILLTCQRRLFDQPPEPMIIYNGGNSNTEAVDKLVGSSTGEPLNGGEA